MTEAQKSWTGSGATSPSGRCLWKDRVSRTRCPPAQTRSAAAAASAATLLALMAGFTISQKLTNFDADPATTAGPSNVLALAGSPAAIPEVLENKARAALEPSVGSLGGATFVAGDDTLKPLPVSEYARARFMYVDFGEDPDHTWRLYLTHGGFGDTGTSIPCGDSVERGLLLACESTIAKGGIAIDVTVLASIRDHVIGAWSQVDQRSLTTRDLPNVRLQRRVQVTRPDRTVVSVREQIFGPASLSADAVFDTSVDTMTRLADDPALRLPH